MKLSYRRHSVLCITLLLSQACYVHREPRDDLTRLQKKRVRIQSPTPLVIRQKTDTVWTVPRGTVTSIEGSLLSVAGDTLVFEDVDGIAKGPESSFRLQATARTLVVRTPQTEVTVRELSRTRTTLLILIPPALYLGLAWYAFSQMSFF